MRPKVWWESRQASESASGRQFYLELSDKALFLNERMSDKIESVKAHTMGDVALIVNFFPVFCPLKLSFKIGSGNVTNG